MLRRLWLIGVLAACLLTIGGPARAAPAPGLAAALVPSRLELSLQPGVTESHIMTLVNKGTEPFLARVEPAAIDLGELEDTYVLDPRRVPVSAASWVSVDPREVLVPPSEERAVNVDVAPPMDASLGSYQAAVFFELQSAQPPQQDATGVALRARVGGMVLVDIAHPDAELVRRGQAVNGHLDVESRHLFRNWRPDIGALFGSRKVRAGIDLQNAGNAYLIAAGSFNFRGGFGGDFSERIGPLVIFQGTGHIFRSEWRDAPFAGSVSLEGQLVYAKGKDGLITIPEHYSTWVVPWPQLELLGILLACAAVVLAWRRRRRKRRPRLAASLPARPGGPPPY